MISLIIFSDISFLLPVRLFSRCSNQFLASLIDKLEISKNCFFVNFYYHRLSFFSLDPSQELQINWFMYLDNSSLCHKSDLASFFFQKTNYSVINFSCRSSFKIRKFDINWFVITIQYLFFN